MDSDHGTGTRRHSGAQSSVALTSGPQLRPKEAVPQRVLLPKFAKPGRSGTSLDLGIGYAAPFGETRVTIRSKPDS